MPFPRSRPLMRSLLGRLTVVALLSACAGCATQSARRTADVDRNVITQAQIHEHRFLNAFDAVSALRSNWLSSRGTDSFIAPGEVQVYLNETRLGGIESLRSIGSTSIVSIRFIDGVAA